MFPNAKYRIKQFSLATLTKRRRCFAVCGIALILCLGFVTNFITTYDGMFAWTKTLIPTFQRNISLTKSAKATERGTASIDSHQPESNKNRKLNNQHPETKSSTLTTYFKLGKNKIVNHNYEFLIKGKVCEDNNPPFLLVLVLSVHTDVVKRKAIRDTWGSISKTGTWPKVGAIDEKVKIVFLFGTSSSLEHQEIIQEESRQHGDIVQADFVDSYYNLTRKVITGMHWASEYCPTIKYILKADEDVFVHIPNLMKILKNETENNRGMIYGHAITKSTVLRAGHWAVSNETYPFSTYPTYASGNTYVISGRSASDIYQVSEFIPYLNIEDAFITGVVRTAIGIELKKVAGFTFWDEKQPEPCSFHNHIKISATKVDKDLMYEIWSGLDKNITNCYFKSDIKTIVNR